MAESTGTLVPPTLDNPDEYRDFMRSEAGSQIKPGSEEEKLIMQGFKAARRSQVETTAQQAVGTEEQPGPLAEELKAVEEGQGNSYVRPEDSQAIHHPDEITITRADEPAPVAAGIPAETPIGPLEANNNPATGVIDPSKLPPSGETMH